MIVDPALGFPTASPAVDIPKSIAAPAVVVRGRFPWEFYAAIAVGLYVFLKGAK